MKTTQSFEEQVLRERPYIDCSQCAEVIARPLARLVQDDGRIRHWERVVDARDGTMRALRVVTLDDGETIHNAFSTETFGRTDHEAALLSGNGQALHRA